MLNAAYTGLFYGITAAFTLGGFILTCIVLYALINTIDYITDYFSGSKTDERAKSRWFDF